MAGGTGACRKICAVCNILPAPSKELPHEAESNRLHGRRGPSRAGERELLGQREWRYRARAHGHHFGPRVGERADRNRRRGAGQSDHGEGDRPERGRDGQRVGHLCRDSGRWQPGVRHSGHQRAGAGGDDLDPGLHRGREFEHRHCGGHRAHRISGDLHRHLDRWSGDAGRHHLRQHPDGRGGDRGGAATHGHHPGRQQQPGPGRHRDLDGHRRGRLGRRPGRP